VNNTNEFVFFVDGHEVNAKEGETILQSSLNAGIYIPHICSHENLEPSGSCRLCMVEIEGMKGVFAACTTKVAAGIKVKIHSELADKVRNLSMAYLFSAHPEECTGCPKYLKCQLQALSQYINPSNNGIRRRINNIAADTQNPLILHEMYRCILCGRCVRVCEEVRGVGALKFEKVNGNLRVVFDGATMEESGCQFCGACVEVCPTGSIRDQINVFDFEKKREDALVPCRSRCPAHVDIPRYIRFIRQRNYNAAAAVVREKAIFAEMLGYICTGFCELDCRRRFLNKSVSICQLKRFACTYSDDSWKKNGFKKSSAGKKVAVIGAGPAGMAAAYYLQKCGHYATIFEKEEAPGGTPRYGIPEYRLPRWVIEKEVSIIRELGVIINLNTPVNNPQILLDKGYDAIFVAIGTGQGVKLPIEGNDAEGVLVNSEYLKAAAKHEKVELGKKVLVLGGGNVACDCAGMAKRLGAEEVHIACLESRETMPASAVELDSVEAEGVILHPAVTFDKIIVEDNHVTGMVFSRVKSFAFDENRQAHLKKEPDSTHSIVADTVIFAVGQRPDIPEGFGLSTGRGNCIATDEQGQTSIPGIFAAGDAVTGTASVVQAIAKARETAAKIDIYLGGDGNFDELLAPVETADGKIGIKDNIVILERNTPQIVTESGPYELADLGLNEECALAETERCLQCDLRLQLAVQKFWSDYQVV
jgi:NADPH-dependent glutamate synthase beta subunit-like oxidoreductase/Pyruvate/2-oxoacid:ferredoxin oxidoreductase delta subunit/ferredoxin